jgi:hypothetical protein
MAVSLADDDLFTRAVSGYREAFWDRHQHLSEAERNLAWTQRLSQFMTNGNPLVPNGGTESLDGVVTNIPDTTRERLPQEPRTTSELPSSGKRRATVCPSTCYHFWISSP